MSEPVFFDSRAGMLRVVTVGLATCASLVLMLCISGKRTPSKMNAFDLVVAVALNPTLATIRPNDAVPLAEGIPASDAGKYKPAFFNSSGSQTRQPDYPKLGDRHD